MAQPKRRQPRKRDDERPLAEMHDDHEQAERLALLPPAVQAKALELIEAPAHDPTLPKRDRDEAARRAKALRQELAPSNGRKGKRKMSVDDR
jgi:hypothetical protein